MSVQHYYKKGFATTDQITAMSGSDLQIGDNVFNIDIRKEEFWTGTVWTNDDCIVLTNNGATEILQGHCCSVIGTTAITLENESSDGDLVGVAHRGGTASSEIVIAQCGMYPVRYKGNNSSVTRKNWANVDTGNPQAQDGAVSDGNTTTTTNHVGIAVESKTLTHPGDETAKIMISIKEMF